jgi:hypothetical protein
MVAPGAGVSNARHDLAQDVPGEANGWLWAFIIPVDELPMFCAQKRCHNGGTPGVMAA